MHLAENTILDVLGQLEAQAPALTKDDADTRKFFLLYFRRLIELLDVPGLVYDGFHDMLKVRVRGTLPQDKEKMLKQFDEAIEKYCNEPPVYAVLGDEHEFSSNDVSTDRIA